MSLLGLFKQEKLKIRAYSDAKRTPPHIAEFEAMFNPSTYSQTYSLTYGNKATSALQFIKQAPASLALDLTLDGTGVDQMGLVALFTAKSVSDRLQQFFDVTYNYDGRIHQPRYLKVTWGDLEFPCRLSSVTIRYTVFDRDGKPLRAELATRFVSDVDAMRRAMANNAQSPDVTHARIVKHGDTLPLLTAAIYGSSARYLDVARYNQLDDFRRLVPGQQLLFPPLAQLTGNTPTSR